MKPSFNDCRDQDYDICVLWTLLGFDLYDMSCVFLEFE